MYWANTPLTGCLAFRSQANGGTTKPKSAEFSVKDEDSLAHTSSKLHDINDRLLMLMQERTPRGQASEGQQPTAHVTRHMDHARTLGCTQPLCKQHSMMATLVKTYRQHEYHQRLHHNSIITASYSAAVTCIIRLLCSRLPRHPLRGAGHLHLRRHRGGAVALGAAGRHLLCYAQPANHLVQRADVGARAGHDNVLVRARA